MEPYIAAPLRKRESRTTAAAGPGQVFHGLWLSLMKVFDRTEGEWILRSEPSLKAKLKEEISLTIGGTETGPMAPPIELGLKVAASNRRPA